MKTIVLISCCKEKLHYSAPAESLYQSAGFKKSLAYAKYLKPDAIYILSAKHHVVELQQTLEWYDECLRDKSAYEIQEWSKICLSQLSNVSDIKKDKFIILTGKDYYSGLIGSDGIQNYELPLKGLQMGYRLQWFDKQLEKNGNDFVDEIELRCDNIHAFANSLPRFSYPFEISKIPENGIYVFFEKGEKYKNWDRIVRVGTHNGDGNLPSRLEPHLCKENKDCSIFRKNIGRAILFKNKSSFLSQWNLDLTSKVNREKYKDIVDLRKIAEIEKNVSEYMRDNLSFSVFSVSTVFL